MENINYFLKENDDNNSNNDNNNVILSSDEVEQFNYTINVHQLLPEVELYYKSNFNVKQIIQILTYYGIQKSINNGNSNGNSKGKMTKDEMIQVLLFFESDPLNSERVQKRLRLWKNIQELKADSYFSKFILF
jgi:hypothetical protein